jgi:hypothetical protein
VLRSAVVAVAAASLALVPTAPAIGASPEAPDHRGTALPRTVPAVPTSCNNNPATRTAGTRDRTTARDSGARTAVRTARPAEVGAEYLTTFYPRWFTYYQAQLAPCNRLVGPDRVGPIYHTVVAINDDTLYASAVVDVRAEPVVVTVPPTTGVYSILHLDGYGTVFPGIPSRQPGTFLLTAPGWTGTPPPGMSQVSLPYGVSIVIFRADRYAADGQSTQAQAEQFRTDLRMATLTQYEKNSDAGPTDVVTVAAFATPFKQIADNLARTRTSMFLTQLQTAVSAASTQPLTAAQQRLADTFDRQFANPEKARKIARGARDAHLALIANYLDGTLPKSQWIHFSDMGDWASNARGTLNRASITEYIQYGNNINAAAYFHAFRDGDGRVLDGRRHVYTLTFKKSQIPDVSRFWSLTAYLPRSIQLVPNPRLKYLVGSYTPGLVTNRNGSITLTMAATRPAGTPAANWLPVPKGPFNVMLRAYGPQGKVARGSYTPPAIARVS